MDTIILSLILVTPLIGALLALLLPDRGKLPAAFGPGTPGFQFVQDIPWINVPAIRYHLGVDGLSLWLVVLTGLLAPIGVLASWKTIQTRSKIYYSLFLVQQTAMLGVFVSLALM